ncbi:MAG: UDP-N-acetylmuramoyl-L-alanine--D-glutamate ligase [Rickettsiales bacterium]
MIKSTIFLNKNYYVYGLGRTGLGAIKALTASGAHVYAWDDSSPKGLTDCQLLSPEEMNWDMDFQIVLSPGIPLSHRIVTLANKHGKEVIADIDLLYLANPNSKFLGITGTNGKSTTTALIGHILQTNNIDADVGGNIGISVLDLNPNKEWYVLELSSYQLELIKYAKMDIAIMLNITPDHLERHGTMQNYISAKQRIFSNNTLAIVSQDSEPTRSIKADIKISGQTKADISCINAILHDQVDYDLNGKKILAGSHNDENIAASYAATMQIIKDPLKVIAAICSFKGLKHRMQLVTQRNGVKFVNDSKATNADAAEKALKTYDNIYWILGGQAKSDGIDSLVPYFYKVNKAFLIGAASDSFAKVLASNNCPYEIVGTLENAIKSINSLGLTSGVVLLSPACASWDQFRDFEHRGDLFCELVAK